jgi:monoamine oxidase
VVVVGGGLAGLAAARLLHDHYPHPHHAHGNQVLLLEASAHLGGRVQHVTGLAPWPVEVGPEFIHGTMNSSFKDVADQMGCHMRELPYPDRYYLGSERWMLSSDEAEEHADIQRVHEYFQGIASEDPDAPDISMAEYFHRRGANDTITQLAESIYANDFGCSLKQLGVRECIQEAQNWIYGDTYLILDRPMSSVVDFIAKGLKVRLDWVVQHVEYDPHGAKLHSSDGRIVTADYVILAIPVSILQHGVPTFNPPLPTAKVKAIHSIGMNNCVKVLMAFSERFWPEDMFDVVCTHSFLPEFWVTQYPSTVSHTDEQTAIGKFVVVGFMAGEVAEAASKSPETEVMRRSLLQLDEIFGEVPETVEAGHCSKCCHDTKRSAPVTGRPLGPGKRYNVLTRDHLHLDVCGGTQCARSRPASTWFQGGCVVNWEQEAFVRGGYTYPSVNAHGARNTLAAPLEGRVFFAGEATHPGVNPCMQAAIDTGRRAARQVLSLEVISRL